jgi:hypothetical protein
MPKKIDDQSYDIYLTHEMEIKNAAHLKKLYKKEPNK